MKIKVVAGVLVAAGLLVLPVATALALKVGDTAKAVRVRNTDDKPTWIPEIGKKVIALFYIDPDAKGQNEQLRHMLKAAKLDRSRYQGIAVANLEDTWKPNIVIRKLIRSKGKELGALILLDPDHTLKDKWKLGDVNDQEVVIIIGSDGKVKYIKKGKMSPTEQRAAMQLVKKLIRE